MNVSMNSIEAHPLRPEQAALWFLGQAGYLVRSGDVAAVIEPFVWE